MATKNQSPLKTVRQVKHVERKRRSQNSLLKPISPAPDSPTKHAHSSEDASDGYVDLSQVQNKTESYTPPPYRMPPYPLYNSSENTPLATPVALPGSSQTAANPPTGLQTHSNKFPIEREVILSSNDKNSKIPILHDYSRNKMHNSGVVGPDIPVKQMQAWSTQPHIVLSPDQAHPVGDNPTMYKAVYHPPASVGHDYQMPIPQTGAVPRSGTLYMGGGGDPTKPAPRPFTNENTIVQIDSSKDNKKTMTKTYHTIKDIISNKFKTSNSNNKEDIVKNKEKEQIVELNNVEDFNKKMHQQYQYQQQQLLAHQAQQQYYQQQQKQQCRPIEQDQQYKMQQMYLASRSQEMLSRPPPTEELYYQTPQSTPQRPPMHKRPPPNLPSTPVQYNSPQNPILRSPQQIERESLKKQCEARRSASQPHLSLDDDDPHKSLQDSRPQPQVDNRRSSYGNIMEFDKHKDADDGGFLGPKQRVSEDTPKNKDELQGTPRKRLEGEIGRIEGVYNVAQRGSKNNDNLESKTSIKASSAASSDYEHKTGEQSSSNFDSGRGSAAYSSSGHRGENSAPSFQKNYLSKGINDSNEWVDLVENEIQNILDPKMHDLSLQNGGGANSTISESISSMTPPLPPLSPGDDSSNNPTPRNSTRLKHSSLPYGSKPNYESFANKNHPLRNGNASKNRFSKKVDHALLMRGSGKHLFGLDTTDLTSTTTRSMDLESMLDCQSDSDENLSIQDARTIRKQLEGLESMYGEVLKILGVKKHQQTLKYEPSNPKLNKRRYGSMSSLPSSSISSRPIRDKRRSHDDRKKVRDMRGINKRFQRLESHVVTLARSVAHLSSEMRTQHIMITEMENIRGEISTLRTQTNMLTVRAQNNSRNVNVNMNNKELPELANPSRVKKLTKFFGDEPPLLRLFLRKLGYEKYANLFENEKIGMVELPYLTEERLLKMGVPLGPRLRIMQEAQISVCKENTLCIV